MSPRSGSAFSLVELAAIIVVACILLALLAAGADGSRRLGKVGIDLSHFRTIAAATGSYGADYEDRVWQFSWQGDQIYWSPSDPNAAGFTFQSNDRGAALQQMTYLIRVRGGRSVVEAPNLTGASLYPYIAGAGLVLTDYLDLDAPSRVFVSATDHRWRWADDPRGYDMGLYTPNLGVGGLNYRHPYTGSLRMGTCFYDAATGGMRAYPTSTTGLINVFLVVGTTGGRQLSLIAHPSQKVFLHDTIARHFGPRQSYHMYPESRMPVLMCDGSAGLRNFAEANLGASPNQPAAASPLLTYTPTPIDPPATGPNVGPVYAGTQWTRMGLAGRDFGGPDVYP